MTAEPAAALGRRGANLAALNRSPEQRARVSALRTHGNVGNSYRLGKYAVPDEVIDAMIAMRRRGRSWAVVGRLYKLSPEAARNRVHRRRGPIC